MKEKLQISNFKVQISKLKAFSGKSRDASSSRGNEALIDSAFRIPHSTFDREPRNYRVAQRLNNQLERGQPCPRLPETPRIAGIGAFLNARTRLSALQSRSARRPNLGCCISIVLFAVLSLIAPQLSHAHGELLIRIAAASREIATNPAPGLYLHRGELYREDQNWAAAENDYHRAAELGIAADDVDLCRAQLFADQNQLDQARELLTAVIEHDPRNGKALLARARLLARTHQPQAAVPDFRRASECGTDLDSPAWLEWAQMLVAEKKSADALAVLDQGIQKTGAVSTLQVYAVDLELAGNHKEAALTRLQNIIDNADRKERWFARRGEIQLAAGDRFGARESYESAIASIKRLPKILQASPAMLNLKSQIDAALAGMGGSPNISKVGVR